MVKKSARAQSSLLSMSTTASASRHIRYTDSDGDHGYFSADGVSMRKAFMLAPLDFTRVSSNFNMRRMHPIMKVIRPHRGVDYSASTGTPVYASGDGKVTASGYSRSNGNYVYIQHDDRYMTRYLHLHKRTVKAGERVKQGRDYWHGWRDGPRYGTAPPLRIPGRWRAQESSHGARVVAARQDADGQGTRVVPREHFGRANPARDLHERLGDGDGQRHRVTRTEMASVDGLFVGLLSGTSIDAIDAALFRIEGDSIRMLQRHGGADRSHRVKSELLYLTECETVSPERIGLVDRQFGACLADAALRLLASAGEPPEAIRAIGSHGQTIRHRPARDRSFTYPGSRGRSGIRTRSRRRQEYARSRTSADATWQPAARAHRWCRRSISGHSVPTPGSG